MRVSWMSVPFRMKVFRSRGRYISCARCSMPGVMSSNRLSEDACIGRFAIIFYNTFYCRRIWGG